jgi:hypothetical protein
VKNRALKLPSRPRPGSRRVSGSAYESDGDDSDGQGAPQGGGGCKAPPSRPAQRTFSFAGFKGSRGQFHEKIGATFYNRKIARIQLFPFWYFSRLSVWREGETPQHKWSLGQRLVLSAWKHAPFFDGQKNPNRPKVGVRTHVFATCGSILRRRAWRVAPAAA